MTASDTQQPRPKPPSGILLVDKPLGVTSHDVVALVRRAAGTRKVGHAGTLDPLATGLLLLGIESSTRLLTYLVGLDKEYLATIRLGESTTTDDAEGETIDHIDALGVTSAAIADGLAGLTGEIDQVPSTFSAIKVDGRRAYDLARSGETVELKSRRVTVSALSVIEERRDGHFVDVDVRATVSSGTYVRALARDLGAALGVGGHLTALRRTSVGPFDVADAIAPDEDVMAGLREPASVAAALFPTVHLDAAQLADLTHGRRTTLVADDDPIADAPIVAAVAGASMGSGDADRLVGLVELKSGVSRVLVNFPSGEVLR